jgi:hypothetical protein
MVLSSFYTYLKLFLAGLDLKTFKSSFKCDLALFSRLHILIEQRGIWAAISIVFFVFIAAMLPELMI